MSKKANILFTLLQGGNPVTMEELQREFPDIKAGSIVCLIFELRDKCGAVIETKRNGRRVESYRLVNPEEVAPRLTLSDGKPGRKKKVAAVANTGDAGLNNLIEKGEIDEVPFGDVQSSDDWDSSTSVEADELRGIQNDLGIVDSYRE